MPFTPIHIIAILPLAFWKRLPFSALAIGCMIPDLPLFLEVIAYGQTHAPWGPITTCWPIGLATFVIFQCWLKIPLWDILPVWIKQRTEPLSLPNISARPTFWLLVSVAIIIGAYSHICWDAFTHKGRWGTKLLPMLNSELEIFGRSLPGYKIFQYGSTLLGFPLLTILCGWKLYRWPANETTRPSTISNHKKLIAIVVLLLAVLAACSYSLLSYSDWGARIVKSVTNSGLAAAIWSCVYAGYYYWHGFSASNDKLQ